MLFDKLCGIVEKNQDQLGFLIDPLREAKLFVFEQAAHEFATPEALDGVDWDLFCLPYRVTAIEDAGSVVLIIDDNDESIGLNRPRRFVELMQLIGGQDKTNSEAFADNVETKSYVNKVNDLSAENPFHSLSISSIHSVDYSMGRKHRIDAQYIAGGAYFEKTGELFLKTEDDMPQFMVQELLKSCSRNAKAALEEIAIALGPAHFVVEISGAKPHKLGPKIPRSHQRPIYTALKPMEIRKRLGIRDPEHHGGIKTPHERRRHLRRLSTAGGHFKQDKIVVIKATWVGQSEAQVGNKKYKVILD